MAQPPTLVWLRRDLRLRAGLVYQERRDAFALELTLGEHAGAVADAIDPALYRQRR